MASVDMCEHDWPGTGCDDCRREREGREQEGTITVEIWPPRDYTPGGQHVGSGPSGIKVTHHPSGIEACVDVSRSQHVNRMIAVDMIQSAITHPRYR